MVTATADLVPANPALTGKSGVLWTAGAAAFASANRCVECPESVRNRPVSASPVRLLVPVAARRYQTPPDAR